MNNQKNNYLVTIRSATTYPVFRGVIRFLCGLLYVAAGLIVLAAMIGAASASRISPVGAPVYVIGGLMAGGLTFILARFIKEAALILADIGDSVVESNSR